VIIGVFLWLVVKSFFWNTLLALWDGRNPLYCIKSIQATSHHAAGWDGKISCALLQKFD
jgi:hypothetical protein